MFCKYCGNQIPETARFCQKCGAKIKPRISPETDSAAEESPQKSDQEAVKPAGQVTDERELTAGPLKTNKPDACDHEITKKEIPQPTSADGSGKTSKRTLPIILISLAAVLILGAVVWFFFFGGSGEIGRIKQTADDRKTEKTVEDDDSDSEGDDSEIRSDSGESSAEIESEGASAEKETESEAASEPVPAETSAAETEAKTEETETKEISVYSGSFDDDETASAEEQETVIAAETKAAETKAAETKAVVKNGWIKEGGYWYYYNAGVKATGWLQDGNKWYYLENSGRMFTSGWKTISGESYYFGADGVMYADTVTPDGSTVDSSGRKVESWSPTDTKISRTFSYSDVIYDEDTDEEINVRVTLTLKRSGDYDIIVRKGSEKRTESGKYKYSEEDEYIDFSGSLIHDGYCNGYLIETSVDLIGDVCLDA